MILMKHSDHLIQLKNKERKFMWIHFTFSMVLLLFVVKVTWYSTFLFTTLFILFVTNFGLALKSLEKSRNIDLLIVHKTIEGLQYEKEKKV